jgi:hypothetical protein
MKIEHKISRCKKKMGVVHYVREEKKAVNGGRW